MHIGQYTGRMHSMHIGQYTGRMHSNVLYTPFVDQFSIKYPAAEWCFSIWKELAHKFNNFVNWLETYNFVDQVPLQTFKSHIHNHP